MVAALIGLRITWWPDVGICRAMTMTGCLTAAAILVAIASLFAVSARAVWLAAHSARALAALPRAPVTPELAAAAQRANVRRLTGPGASGG
jgi:hypothetical protein